MVKKHVHNLLPNNLSTIVKISYLSAIWFFFEKEHFVLVLKLFFSFCWNLQSNAETDFSDF